LLIPQELIIKAKEQMGDRAAYIIAEALHLQEFDERNLKALCPFHEEQTPSFVWNPKNYSYHCFGCGRNFGILDLYIQQGYTYLGAVEKLFEEVGIKYSFGTKNIKTKREYKYPKEETNTDRSKVEQYLTLRCISKETLDYCDIRQDSHGNIVFNYYDTNDVLTMVKYRPARKLNKGEIKCWCQKGADTTPLLFNINRIDPTQPLLICEGELDCLSAIEAGFKNTVSVPFGAGNESWVEENWDWLEQFNKIIIWADADETGRKMKKNIIPRLGQWRCYEVEAPTEIEKDGKTIYIKDINEVLYYYGKDKIIECIDNAKEIPITDVVDLYDIQEFDVETAEGVFSGFEEIDKWIYKFFFGCINIITGINGCVDSETEYFNGMQWKKISEYTEGEKVLQYNDDGTATLVEPIQYIKQPCNEFYLIKSKYGVEQCVTKEHNIVYLTSKGNIQKIKFEELLRRHNELPNGFYGKFITTFKYSGNKPIPLNEYQLRLMVAVSADGHYPNGTNICRMRLKKERKKERLRWLLKMCNMPIDERQYKGENSKGYSEFYFHTPVKFKQFPVEWYNAPIEQLKIIFDEVFHWDGYKNKAYFTTIKENADFIQFVGSACGYRTVIKEDIRENKPITYCVYMTKSIYPTIMNLGRQYLKERHIQPYNNHDWYKYCFTVPSGMLVLRRNGKINITGNSGKSVLINQMCICEPLNQGYDIFVFSGEMTKPQLKKWIELQLAGRRHVEVEKGHIRKIKPEIRKQMRDWYRGRIYVYDNDKDFTATSILNKMEELARKKGVKVFVLDNLMMIDLECNNENIWQKQKEFVVKLVNFAHKFNVLVHLVAHPRKVETIRRLTKLDVGGSGDITNLAHYVMSIHRVIPKEKEGIKNKKGEYVVQPVEYDCIIDLFKNRITGTQDKELGVYFDSPSYRLWSTKEELDKVFKWDKNKYNDDLPDPRDESLPEFMRGD